MDIREASKLTGVQSKFLDDNIDLLIKSYNEFIGTFIEINNLQGINLLLRVTCRNPYDSPLFGYFSRLFLFENSIQSNLLPEIVNIDDIQYEAINFILVKYNLQKTIKIQTHKTPSIINKVILNIIKSSYFMLSDWFWPKVIRIKKVPKGDVIYVDTFLQLSTIDQKGFFTDRHYFKHQKFLPNQAINQEWFAPTLNSIKYPSDYIKIFKRIKKSKTKFLIQESWLTFTDYLFSFLMAIVIPMRKMKFNDINGLPVDNITKAVIFSDIGSTQLMKAIYRYRFIKRLAINKINVQTAIDWHENQVIDRALNLSFRKFYPNIIVKGYQGFPAMRSYLSLQPTCFENNLNTLPHEIHVIADIYKQPKLDTCSLLNIKVSPAYRYSYLFNLKKITQKNKIIILVLLPGIISECREIINSANYLRETISNDIELLIKIHPQYSFNEFISLVPEFKGNKLNITNKKLLNLLPRINVLITSGSSSAVEAISLGIPTAICSNLYGVTNNFIPPIVSKDLWTIFYNCIELKKFVDDALSREVYNESVGELFCKPDRQLTKSLFGF